MEEVDRLFRLLEGLRARNAAVAGVVTAGRREDQIDLQLAHGGLKLTGVLRPYEVVIAAEHGDECWDFLLSIEAAPQQVDGGWQCRLCDENQRSTFPSIDALLIDHLYDPLAAWIEEKLVLSVGLAMFRRNGATWAKLVRSEDEIEGANHVVWV